MVVTTAGKDYIARNFGVGNCFAATGLSWTTVGTDGSTTPQSGGTASIVGQLVTTAVVSEIRLTAPRTGTFTYAQLKAANGGQDITLPEVASEIVGVTYCEGTTPPPGGITTSGKDYIATNFGVNNCFAASGLSWTVVGTDGSTTSETGGTGSIVGQLVTTAVVSEIRLTAPRTGTFTYAQLKAANGGQDITLPMVSSEIVGVSYCASGAPPTPPPGPPGPYIPPSPPPTGYAQLRLCTVPGGVHPVIDDDVNPQVTYPCSDLNPRWIGVNVPIGGAVQKYKVQFELLPDFERHLNTAKSSPGEDYWGPFVDGQVVYIRHALVASPGAAMGVLFMNAKDIDTEQWLAARPNINGIGGEEHMLMLGEKGLTLNLPVGTYEVTCTYPGYRTPDRVTVRLTEDFGVSNPYIIPTFLMKEVRIHKVIEVRERAMKAAWVTAFDIESPLIHGVPSKGSITFEFLEEAAYRVFFALHPLPEGWDQSKPVGELPASVINVFCSITGDYTLERDGKTLQVLNPLLHTNRKYRAPFEVILERGPNAVLPGWYVAVTVIERWKEIL